MQIKKYVIRSSRFCVREILTKIHLVDKSLMIFMAVLLIQSAYSLFVPPVSGEVAGDIDIIVRTSSAAIFGYFLSANFIRRAPAEMEPSNKKAHRIALEEHPEPTKQLQEVPSSVDSRASNVGQSPVAREETNCFQVIAATGIGLFCLITLLLLRNTGLGDAALAAQPDRLTATVAQFRDFISGCVGFLIGCPTHSSTPQS